MLGKFILLGLTVWLILNLLSKYRRSVDHQEPIQPLDQDMVQCANCGVHLPKSEGIEQHGQYYCCVEHSPRNQP